MKSSITHVHHAPARPEVYSGWHALLDFLSLTAFVSAMTVLMISLWGQLPQIWVSYDAVGWLLLLLIVAALLSADFVSGLVHFLADNFGNPDTPVLGRVFIFPFREHHVDAKAITRHSYLETNGANCLISLPFVSCVLLFAHGEMGFFIGVWTWFFLTAIFFTNQIHKWAHTDRPPEFVRALQKWRIILSPENHAVHHTAPHDQHYCITGGWLNAPLRHLQFFTRLKTFLKRRVA